MSFVVVIIVALLAYAYVRSNRQARTKWLQKVDLPGHWRQLPTGSAAQEETSEESASEENLAQSPIQGGITFAGSTERGDFRSANLGLVDLGEWQIQGHTLILQGARDDQQIVLDLHFFKPGQIGLERQDGSRLLLIKQADNVVALRPRQQG